MFISAPEIGSNMEICNQELPTLSAPSEVLEHIFGFLDAPSFCTSRQVCKTWNEVIKSLHRKNSVWRQFCLREIPRSILEEILCFKSSPCTDNIHWMTVYKKWFFSRMVLRCPYWKKKIPAYCNNPVTCVRTSGSWILTGHNNGLLCTWNMVTGELHQSLLCHLKVITDMALIDLLNLGLYYGLEEELPWAHHHLITISKDRYIHVLSLLEPMICTDSDLHLSCHGDDLVQIRVFDDCFAVLCRDNTVSLWRMQVEMAPYFHLKVSLLQKIIGPADYIFSLGLWHGQVRCISRGGRLREFCAAENEWVCRMGFTFSSLAGESLMGVHSTFLFRKDTVVLMTVRGEIYISVGRSSPVRSLPMPWLGTDIITVAFRGTILALGGENGKLYVYHVPEEGHLPALDLGRPAATLSLSEGSIVDIDISCGEDACPVIVASATDCIYVVQWHKGDARKVRRRNLVQSALGRS